MPIVGFQNGAACGSPQWIVKLPDWRKDYSLDWLADKRIATGDTITSSTWDVPADLVNLAQSVTGPVTTVWIGGGTVGKDYLVTNTIQTAFGVTDSWVFEIRVRED